MFAVFKEDQHSMQLISSNLNSCHFVAQKFKNRTAEKAGVLGARKIRIFFPIFEVGKGRGLILKHSKNIVDDLKS